MFCAKIIVHKAFESVNRDPYFRLLSLLYLSQIKSVDCSRSAPKAVSHGKKKENKVVTCTYGINSPWQFELAADIFFVSKKLSIPTSSKSYSCPI